MDLTQQQRESFPWSEQESRNGTVDQIATGLGWFSIGLGLAEILAPGGLARLIGVSDDDGNRSLLRFYGVREVAAGVGILTQPRPAGWLWGRVAGDLLDLASLGNARKSDRNEAAKLSAATAAVVGVTALDLYCARQLSNGHVQQAGVAEGSGVEVKKTVFINRAPEEVYRFWHNFQNLPRFMTNLESVQETGNRRSHWVAKAVGGKRVEWDAEITDDQPNSLIAWRSLEGSDVPNSGSVRFEAAPGNRGTYIKVELRYDPPGGAVGAAIAKLFGTEPGQQIDHDLRVLKQIIETGEIVKSDASIHSGMHPAQPSAETEEVMR